MPHYRICHRDSKGDLEGPPDVIEFDDDDAAVKHAHDQSGGRSRKVWQGDRLVAVILADGTYDANCVSEEERMTWTVIR
jgi:hypothetical protein